MIDFLEKYSGGDARIYLGAWVIVARTVNEKMAYVELIKSAVLLILNFDITDWAMLWDIVSTASNRLASEEHNLMVVLSRVFV